jgi:hypothetical protein
VFVVVLALVTGEGVEPEVVEPAVEGLEPVVDPVPVGVPVPVDPVPVPVAPVPVGSEPVGSEPGGLEPGWGWPEPGGQEHCAPAAGLAVRISGATQATAPAVAKADMRPRAWRRERG